MFNRRSFLISARRLLTGAGLLAVTGKHAVPALLNLDRDEVSINDRLKMITDGSFSPLDVSSITRDEILDHAKNGVKFALDGVLIPGETLAATCGWYNVGVCSGCGAGAYQCLPYGYFTYNLQYYYCNGVYTGNWRCNGRAYCGC